MKKVILWILLILLLLMAAAGTAVYFLFIVPYRDAASAMPGDVTLTIQQDAGGALHLSWPEAKHTDYYCIEIQLPQTPEEIAEEVEPTVVFRDFVRDATTYTLPRLPVDTELVLQVNTVIEYEAAGEIRQRMGDDPVRLTTTFNTPAVTDIQWTVDPEADSITVSYQLKDADHCRIYRVETDGTLTLLKTLTQTEAQITFGEGADLPLPTYETPCTLAFDAYRLAEGLEFYGYESGDLSVVREDLLGRDLALVCTDEGHNVCTLTWAETKGEYYQLQKLDKHSLQWVTVCEIPRDGERTYTTGHLENLSEFSFRVLAVGGQTMPDSIYAAVSEEITFETGASPIYCTIWPVKDLEAFSAPKDGEVVGKVKAAKAYCVIDEADGMFGIRLDGQTCYIDSNYCMINLVEIFGDLLSYNITNSYHSIYMVHEYEIPEVTDVVTAGYEAVRMSTGDFLVPLLYPTSQKLLAAAQNAVSQGYRLKIYDAYRPNKATVEIYDLTEKILDDPIPDEPFTNKAVDDLPEVEEGEELTYRLLMTNDGEWQLGNFLAKGGSLHNLGIAVDLTLEKISNGEELEMQTSMHDLSYYSILRKNNGNANLLSEIMTGAGLGGLTSEWWHFQDNDARKELSLPTVWSGVTPECWMADDNGWRYRRYNGTYFTDCTRTIDGVDYTFDADGYVVEQ